MSPKNNPTDSPAVNQSPGHFLSGESLLMAFWAARYHEAALGYIGFIMSGPTPLESARIHQFGAVTFRRAMHFGLLAIEVSTLNQNVTWDCIQDERLCWLQQKGIDIPNLNSTLANLGLRHMQGKLQRGEWNR